MLKTDLGSTRRVAWMVVVVLAVAAGTAGAADAMGAASAAGTMGATNAKGAGCAEGVHHRRWMKVSKVVRLNIATKWFPEWLRK